MVDSLCSYCQIFGKPSTQINFIILAGGPDTTAYERIKYFIQNYSQTSTSFEVNNLTNYDALMTIQNRIFDHKSQPSSTNSVTTNPIHTCCRGHTTLHAKEYETLRKEVDDLLNKNALTWILVYGSVLLDPDFLKIVIDSNNQKQPPVTTTFAVLGLLVNEEKLFMDWICQSAPYEEYINQTYPNYRDRTRRFFSLLNSSLSLREHTLLVQDNGDFASAQLQEILKDLFDQKLLKYSSNNDNVRSSMEKLLGPHNRTVQHVRYTTSHLKSYYAQILKRPLETLCSRLKNTDEATEAVREVVYLVLRDMTYADREKRKAYKRHFLCGFKDSDVENSDTIAAQLILYAQRLLASNDESTFSLLYAILWCVCQVSKHFFFRHKLFSNTRETFELSLSLVCHQNYALILAGLDLCEKILSADLNEHRYAHVYLSVDPSTARKILNAIMQLLLPYRRLKEMYRDEALSFDSESDDRKSRMSSEMDYCFQHTEILANWVNFEVLSSLFYASFDHSSQVTADDVHTIVDAIEILTDPKFAVSSQIADRSNKKLLLIINLYALLTSFLINGSISISTTVKRQVHLLTIIPSTIGVLFRSSSSHMNKVDIPLRLYSLLVQSKTEHIDEDEDEKEYIETPNVITTVEPANQPKKPSTSTKDLLSAYHSLHEQLQILGQCDETGKQLKDFQKLYDSEWEKINILQLKCDYEHLKQEKQSLNERFQHLEEELQRTKADRDEYQKENIRMAKEIDRLIKLGTSANVVIQSGEISTSTSSEKDNTVSETDDTDQLPDVSPDQITSEQAEQFIRKICHRRETFKDKDMRESICGSLRHLGSDLYSSSVHFLDELIQNAEDNLYTEPSSPSLRIELNHDYILFSNNERGLRYCDVSAICSLAVTTKTGERKHIGEKGVGFKSVFAASNQPALFSHAWRFRFEVPGRDEMSYITPKWIAEKDIPSWIAEQISTRPQHTHLYLPLKLPAGDSSAEQFLNDVWDAVDSCILLNMSHLENLEVVDRRKNASIVITKQKIGLTKLETQPIVPFEDLTFLDLKGSMVRLRTPEGDETFRVYSCQIEVPSSIEQRKDPTTTLTIAFPCNPEYTLKANVYTGLPVCDLGFNFIFNAEFHLVTNRENVLENAKLNIYLRDHLAVLFIYLLSNDIDLKRDIGRFCPLGNTHHGKRSSWWLSMVDRIRNLFKKHLSDILGIRAGKIIRYWNPNLAPLISAKQLENYANIRVIDATDKFYNVDLLESIEVKKVSIADVLTCFPNRDEESNEFQQWALKQDESWWSQLFHCLLEGLTPDISQLMFKKPIFLLQDSRERQYLPTPNGNCPKLYINDDSSIRIWKPRLTVLQYASLDEKAALLRFHKVQILTEQKLIEIIQCQHLDLCVTSIMILVDESLLEEIWKDLSYLQSRVEKLDASNPLLVPIQGSDPCLTSIQNATLPTILSLDIRRYVSATPVTFVRFPYFTVDSNHLINHLQWEDFLLKMGCKHPSINLPDTYTLDQLPTLPLFTMFTNEKYARLGEFILSAQPEDTQQALRQFPIVSMINSEQRIQPVSMTFNQFITADFVKLPRVDVPPYCCTLAMKLGVRAEYDLITCMNILRHLSSEKIDNVDLYLHWLTRLQLDIKEKIETVDKESFLSDCQLYLPDQEKFCLLKDLLIVAEIDN
ncbi:unnamed protein product, partial [Adineta ricciae]